MAVRFVKLKNTEELIADVESKNTTMTLKNPVRILATPQGIGMAPYCPFSKDDKIDINYEEVLFESELEEDIYNAYQEKFGTGIILSGPAINIVDK